MNFIPINLNDKIKFKITPTGESYLNYLATHDPVYITCGRPKFDDCGDGYFETQLWNFANIFGQRMYMGGGVPVETVCFLQHE